MERKIITTADGSKTIQLVELDEQYHSLHGALQESQHVFIKHGLQPVLKTQLKDAEPISILEIGFGTGLNAMTTLIEAKAKKASIYYVGVEAYPVSQEEILELNYDTLFSKEKTNTYFKKIHASSWGKPQEISSFFTLDKQQKFFHEIADENTFNLIYFDAFGPRVQPKLWTESMFQIMFNSLKEGGVLVTYSAKGSVRRAMQSVGFLVEKLPGPPGKREMLRCTKHPATLT
ncbi:tRNA (5-methylaminomethyl-2-thiouridine)(34)-methyltransferase MnmD [Xanthomarina sp. F2636L]|uniref:tRNA (5-methylaminomethyl-2-thiouridine)(34)-methyltransferase MnmD n=1 Tax=Xanthomarina sp. F2636L TaxID=2996018 RepID=UPI00225E5258|nr:tRNA (5-methylaminomethyl-2-thiouridine)(34)-methyltransferase MnmD [Xanthomarina sp. F2636L]MCX7550521.1 tRNA (5-methylaminomethyl-2-thiouridine)(34)-methyltransferase MnmD [Xanthomarina sp. F2636L]